MARRILPAGKPQRPARLRTTRGSGAIPGTASLMHVGAAEDGTTLDAAALPRLVDAVRERGYRFVTVAPYVR